jgi:VWFA-related protein
MDVRNDMRHLALFLVLALMAPAQETPVFRIGTRLVELNVVVTGKDGKPLKDLTENDFEVVEGGKVKPLAFFNPVDTEPAVQAELPPGVFSNRPEYAPAPPRSLTVILLDWLNTDPRDQQFARAQVAQFLKDMNQKDRVAIYTLGARLRVAHDFSDDPASLAKAAEKIRAEWPPTGLNDEQNLLKQAELAATYLAQATEQTEQDAINEAANFSKELRVGHTLKQFEFIGQRLAGMPGRKNLVWVSAGVPLLATWSMMQVGGSANPGMRTFAKEFERAVRAVTDAGVSVYAIDARGLRTDVDAPTMTDVRTRRPGFAGAEQAGMRDAMAGDTLSSIQGLAEETGGRVLRNMNELAGGIRQSLDDAASSYTVAYYTDEDKNRKPRKLEIRLKRKDAVAYYRKSVNAGPVAVSATGVELMQHSLAATGVLVNAQVIDLGSKLNVTVQIDPSGLTLRPEKGAVVGQVELYYAVVGADGKSKVDTSKVNLKLTEAQAEQLGQNGLVLPKELGKPGNAKRLRILVRDAESGAGGVVDVDLSKAGKA